MKLSEILADYAEVDHEAGAELASVADLARTTGRKGSITVKFTAEQQGTRIVLAVGHEARPPKTDAEIRLWHLGPDGLTKDDPYQTRFDPESGELIPAPHPRKD